MTGKLKDLTINRDGTQNVTVTVSSDFRNEFDRLKNNTVSVEIKKYSRKRSLDANAYCWALIGKIAENQNISKNEVYRKEVLDHGAFRVHCLENKEVEASCRDWCSFGLGFQVEPFQSKIPGCTNVIFYKGSSYYTTQEMAKLIDGIIQDAENLGIPTITKEQEQELINKWGKKHKDTSKPNAEGEG